MTSWDSHTNTTLWYSH